MLLPLSVLLTIYILLVITAPVNGFQTNPSLVLLPYLVNTSLSYPQKRIPPATTMFTLSTLLLKNRRTFSLRLSPPCSKNISPAATTLSFCSKTLPLTFDSPYFISSSPIYHPHSTLLTNRRLTTMHPYPLQLPTPISPIFSSSSSTPCLHPSPPNPSPYILTLYNSYVSLYNKISKNTRKKVLLNSAYAYLLNDFNETYSSFLSISLEELAINLNGPKFYPSLLRPTLDATVNKIALLNEISERRKHFIKSLETHHHHSSSPEKDPNNLTTDEQYSMICSLLHQVLNQTASPTISEGSASLHQTATVLILFDTFLRFGSKISESQGATLFYIASSSSPPSSVECDSFETYAKSLADFLSLPPYYHSVLYPPSLRFLTLKLKNLIDQGRVDEAIESLNAQLCDIEGTQQHMQKKDGSMVVEERSANTIDGGLKFRLFAPIFHYLTSSPALACLGETDGSAFSGDPVKALNFYNIMVLKLKENGVEVGGGEVLKLLQYLIECGVFSDDGDEQDNGGIVDPFDKALVLELLDNVGRVSLGVSKSDALRFVRSLDSKSANVPFSALNKTNSSNSSGTGSRSGRSGPRPSSGLKISTALATVPLYSKPICSLTNATLKQIPLTALEKSRLESVLFNLAEKEHDVFWAVKNKGKMKSSSQELRKPDPTSNFSTSSVLEGEKGSKTRGVGYAELLKFKEWINNSTKGTELSARCPFTAILDAANIAYYAQSSSAGHFSLSQVAIVKEVLEMRGERVLVVLPLKYGLGARKDRGTIEGVQFLKAWDKEGALYRVPFMCLDDYYWMISSICQKGMIKAKPASSTAALKLEVRYARAGNSDGDGTSEISRFIEGVEPWPKLRPLIISNDLMRDHRLESVGDRTVGRWIGGHVVGYDFIANINDSANADSDTNANTTTASLTSRDERIAERAAEIEDVSEEDLQVLRNERIRSTLRFKLPKMWTVEVQKHEAKDGLVFYIPIIENEAVRGSGNRKPFCHGELEINGDGNQGDVLSKLEKKKEGEMSTNGQEVLVVKVYNKTAKRRRGRSAAPAPETN